MPIDYSNSVIYKIYCKDENVKDVYVGETTDFIRRKYAHKINSKKKQSRIQNFTCHIIPNNKF